MKITVEMTVDVDAGAWAMEYGTSTDCVSIRTDVRSYVKNLVHSQLDSVGVLTPPISTRSRIADCTCVYSCADDPATRCSLSGEWHVHPASQGVGFGLCPVHPAAPGDK